MESSTKKTELSIADNIQAGLSNLVWFKAILIATISESDTVSIDLKIFRLSIDEVGNRYFYDNLFNISEHIRELKSLYKGSCNKISFTIFQNNTYSLEYIWDNEFYLQDKIELAKASVTILYERFYEVLSFDILPDINWGQAEVKSSIINGSIANRAYTLNKEFDLKLPEKWEKYLLNLHSKTNEEDADSYWGRWDTVTIQMRYEDNFSFDKDVQFSLMAKS